MTIRGLLMILWCGLLPLIGAPAQAKQTTDNCKETVLRSAFKGYAKPGQLQCQLNQWQYKIRIDNLMGSETYDALRKFCLSQNLTETGGALVDTLVKRLESLPGPTCDGAASVSTQVDQASTPVQDRSGTPVVYRLSEEDFTELAARGDVLQQLETLKDVPFLTERALKSEVEKSLADLTRLSDQYAEAALEAAQKIDSVRLTKNSFTELRKTDVPEAAIALVQPLQDVPFVDANALETAVLLRLQSVSPPTDNAASTEDQGPKETNAAAAAPDYGKFASTIKEKAEQVKVYQLTEPSFKVLEDSSDFKQVPTALLERLVKLQGVEAIDQSQYRQAIVGTLDIVYRHYLRMIVEAAGDSAWISAEVLETLKSNGLPDDILDKLDDLEKKDYADPAALEEGLRPLLQAQVTEFEQQDTMQSLVQQARRVIPDALGELPIPWDGSAYGCSRRFSKEVYGFYPFWLADQVEKPEGDAKARAVQSVDFSTLTRIGYYGLYLDENGELGPSRQWDNAGDLNFVKQADKYRTHLDLVVYTDAWAGWSDAQMNRAAKAVADKLNLPLKPAFGNRLKALLPFVDDSPATLGDGVTIYFQNVADTEADARGHIVSFLQKLHQQLSLLPKNPKLNIMYEPGSTGADRQSSLLKPLAEQQNSFSILPAEEQSSFLELLAEEPELLGIQGSGEAYIDSILVLLDEPTTDSKKRLRARIENTFKGKDRRTVLRKILPVISPVGQDQDPNGAYAQFTDDLIYFEDNFSGVGLWPLPLTSQVDVSEIGRLITENFEPDEEQDTAQSLVVEYFPQLCDCVCPNRWLFRILLDVLAIVLLVLGLVLLGNCRWRERIKANPWPVLGLIVAFALVIALSLVCDPFLSEKANLVAFGLLLLLLLIIGWRFFLKFNQGKLP